MQGKLFSCQTGMNSIVGIKGEKKERLSAIKNLLSGFLLLQAAWTFQGQVRLCCTLETVER